MTEPVVCCRFRKSKLTLEQGVLRIDAEQPAGEVSYTLALKEYFPFLVYDSRVFRLFSLTRWGCLLLMLVMLFASVAACASENGAVLYFTVPMALFGFGCLIGSFVEKGKFTLVRKTAFWGMVEGEKGTVDQFLSPLQLSNAQETFLVELERRLREHSLQEGKFKTFTCGWNPDAFDILKRLFDEGVLSPEEFARFKRERIERIIPGRE